jgi:hypothetical protein
MWCTVAERAPSRSTIATRRCVTKRAQRHPPRGALNRRDDDVLFKIANVTVRCDEVTLEEGAKP